MIQDMGSMFTELLKEYENKNEGRLPEQIVIYRDGVSEGQFVHVIENEITDMRKAARDYKMDYKPKLTFVVVQKRHHTRFIPVVTPRRGKNVPPGTLVDTDVVSLNDFDFYLCSHEGIQVLSIFF